MDDTTSPLRHWIRGWKGICWLITVFIVIGMAAIWWYHDTSDLEAIRADAASKGIPTTWAAAKVVLSPADELARYQRLGKLSESLKDYGSTSNGMDKRLRLKPYLPIPQEARDHHAKLDPTQLSELLDLIDGLPHAPLTLRVEQTASTPMPEIGWQRGLTRLLNDRVLLAEPEHLVEEHRRLLHIQELRGCRFLIDLLVHLSCLNVALDATAARLPELKIADPELAILLEGLDRDLEAELIAAFQGEFILCLHSVTHVDEARASMGTATGFWEGLLLGPSVRYGREELLREELVWIQEVQKQPSPRDLVLLSQAVLAKHAAMNTWQPRNFLLRMSMNVVPYILKVTASTRTRLHLMIAELSQRPWPTDPYDPTGSTLRRLERDGHVMGAYTVYEDGADNGGKRPGDRYYPLYGPSEPPATPSP